MDMPSWRHNKPNGPDTWHKHWPIATNPRLGQSPIDIVTRQVEPAPPEWRPLKMLYQQKQWTLLNNGHFFQMDTVIPDDLAYNKLCGGPLRKEYKLQQFHFHWGARDTEGSEHTVDGYSYGAEAHFLHYDAVHYKTWQEAVHHEHGLTVIGVFFQVGKHNDDLQKIIDRFDKIQYSGDSLPFEEEFDVATLMPNTAGDYWYYYGALTGPPLGESVNWIIYKQPLQISTQQLAQFRQLHVGARDAEVLDDEGGMMISNTRPVQPKDFVTTDEDGQMRHVTRRVLHYQATQA